MEIVAESKRSQDPTLTLHQKGMDDSSLEQLRNMHHVQKLLVPSNNLTSLPDSIVNVSKQLQELDCSRNQISVLTPRISMLNSLTELFLLDNILSVLPDELGQLAPQLRVLGLSGNEFTSVPAVILKLTNLDSLWLSYNKIQDLPDALFTSLPNIKKFTCGFNKLKTINPEVRHWKLAEKLVFKCNEIEYIPAELLQLPRLNSLEVNGNPLHVPSTLNKVQDSITCVPCTMVELCARSILSQSHTNPRLVDRLPPELRAYLTKNTKCSKCQKDCLVYTNELIAFETIANEISPILHRFCSWNCVQSLLQNTELYTLPPPDEPADTTEESTTN